MSLSELFNQVTFLFGAGASKDAGCFLSAEMLDSLRNDILEDEEINKGLGKHFIDIHDFVLASLSYQFTLRNPSTGIQFPRNIEDFVAILNQIIDKEYIVPYPLVGNWNEKISRWENIDQDIFGTFRNFVEKLLITKYVKHDKDANAKVLSPIKDLICQSAEQFEIDLFTLNYDLTFEEFFNSPTETLLNDGFESDRWIGNFEQKQQKLNYYKLHGSINWYLDEEESVKKNHDYGITTDPLIIFGSAPKMLSFDPFLFMLSKFRKKLEQSTLYIVIGYSFHDKYINNLLIQQLAMKPERKLLVVNPKIESKKAFVSELGQIQKMKSINDKISFTQISEQRIEIEKLNAKEFYIKYLANNAKFLSDKVEAILVEDRPFG